MSFKYFFESQSDLEIILARDDISQYLKDLIIAYSKYPGVGHDIKYISTANIGELENIERYVRTSLSYLKQKEEISKEEDEKEESYYRVVQGRPTKINIENWRKLRGSDNKNFEMHLAITEQGARKWIPILLRDEFLSIGWVTILKINSDIFFEIIDDNWVVDKTNVPDSVIGLSKQNILPIEHIEVIDSFKVTKRDIAQDIFEEYTINDYKVTLEYLENKSNNIIDSIERIPYLCIIDGYEDSKSYIDDMISKMNEYIQTIYTNMSQIYSVNIDKGLIRFHVVEHIMSYWGDEGIIKELKDLFPFPVYISATDIQGDNIGIYIDSEYTIKGIFEHNEEATDETVKMVDKIINGDKGKVITIYGSHNENVVSNIENNNIIPKGMYISPSLEYAKSYWGEN
jgi:hypothetical protein